MAAEVCAAAQADALAKNAQKFFLKKKTECQQNE